MTAWKLREFRIKYGLEFQYHWQHISFYLLKPKQQIHIFCILQKTMNSQWVCGYQIPVVIVWHLFHTWYAPLSKHIVRIVLTIHRTYIQLGLSLNVVRSWGKASFSLQPHLNIKLHDIPIIVGLYFHFCCFKPSNQHRDQLLDKRNAGILHFIKSQFQTIDQTMMPAENRFLDDFEA